MNYWCINRQHIDIGNGLLWYGLLYFGKDTVDLPYISYIRDNDTVDFAVYHDYSDEKYSLWVMLILFLPFFPFDVSKS